jgi:formylglycine-generating enzyme required for sulfatase activity
MKKSLMFPLAFIAIIVLFVGSACNLPFLKNSSKTVEPNEPVSTSIPGRSSNTQPSAKVSPTAKTNKSVASPVSPTAETNISVASQVSSIDGMTLFEVSAGEFMMGSSDAASSGYPQHQVNLDAFWIDQTEVTNAMFAKFVKSAKYQTDAEKAGFAWVFTNPGLDMITGANWQHPQGPDSTLSGLDDYPVGNVSWNDAKAYCEWAGRRLPTEAEWQKAAVGTDGREYPWGNSPIAGNLANLADSSINVNWAVKSINDGYERSAPVGSFPDGKSPYGTLDMAGNVAEWVADWSGPSSSEPETKPQGPFSGETKIYEGGSWYGGDSITLRPASRKADYPNNSFEFFGFRCALSEK